MCRCRNQRHRRLNNVRCKCPASQWISETNDSVRADSKPKPATWCLVGWPRWWLFDLAQPDRARSISEKTRCSSDWVSRKSHSHEWLLSPVEQIVIDGDRRRARGV